MSENFSFDYITAVLNKIHSQPQMGEVLNLSGGVAPYVLTSTPSNRGHGDLDFVVKQEHMEFVREMLSSLQLYEPGLDSLNINSNNELDHGVCAFIGGVPVGFIRMK